MKPREPAAPSSPPATLHPREPLDPTTLSTIHPGGSLVPVAPTSSSDDPDASSQIHRDPLEPVTSRRRLRLGLALVAAIDLASVAVQVLDTSPGPRSHPLAPAWLLAPGGDPQLTAAIAIPGLLALLAFARAWHPLRSGALALLSFAILNEAHAALVHGPSRPYFFSGALLLAWLAGTALSRELHRHQPRSLARDERHAEAAAIGVLAAIYVGAGLSKLLHSGVGWADAQTLRAIILSHHRVDDTSLAGTYAHYLAARPQLTQLLSTLTLGIQLGAPLMLVGPRLRAAWGLLLLGFHVQISLLTGIGYLQAKLLVPLFTLPWPQLLARLRHRPRPPDPALTPTNPRRTLGLAALVLALLAALLWLSPLRRYTDLHHAERGRERATGTTSP